MLGLLLTSLVVFASSVSLAASNYLFRRPALSRTRIVFSYAGDLWSVPREGGEAKRLTTGPGVETDPVVSPDGSQIAFTGEYDGNVDVFVMPASGGAPKRLTYHPGEDRAVGWSPDGKRVLFNSTRSAAMDGWLPMLYTIPLEGGFPDEIALPIALEGSYSPDGSHLAYVPVPQGQEAWKRYRGGQTKKIWIADLSDSSVVGFPRENSNDFNPMWVGETIYFLSDRNGPVSLFSYDTRSRQVKQVVENRGLDFKSASAGPGAIVYEQFGSLHLCDLRSGNTKPVEARLAGDLPEVRPHFVNVGKRLHHPDLSPNGARAVFEARGEILTLPAEKGDPRNLTNTPGVYEREPAWSPDGKTIAYFSDESGEYALHLREQSGLGEVKKISLGEKPAFYSAPRWSPDSKWLAYRRQLKSHMTAIFIYSLADAKSTQVTDGMSAAEHPVFDKNGKYLYFTASTDSGAAKQPDVLSRTHPVTRSIYLMVLSKDQASPLAPESDEEKKSEDRSQESGEKKVPATPETVVVKIDFDNIGQRILALPMPPRRYEGLQIGKAGMLYALEAPALRAPAGSQGEPKLTVHRFDLSKRKSDVAIDGVRSFRISASGEKVLYQQDDRWVITTEPPPGEPGKGVLKTENLEVRVDPRAEWRQMYREVWRLQRDFFYDTNYHGLDLKAAEKRYEPCLDNLASRRDLNYLFEEMLGELSVSHLFIGGGDSPEVKSVGTGLLGADYRIENGRYRFTRVYNGENWNRELKAPLTQPGVNVVAGEYLLAVNGRELRAADDIYSFFEGAAGKQAVLKVGPDPSGAKAREVTVTPIADDFRLRRLAWIEDNRRKVDQMTNGRVAYIHMPDTASGGDLLPWYFRRFGVGKLVGKRTWGGTIGNTGYPDLMDGGAVTARSALVWNPNGQWEIENQGVAPDIEVELDPKALRQGHDPQLEKAVEVVMAELAKNPVPQPKHPPYPNYHVK